MALWQRIAGTQLKPDHVDFGAWPEHSVRASTESTTENLSIVEVSPSAWRDLLDVHLVADQLRHVPTEGLQFRLVDAKDQVVGRLAAKLSVILQGKDKPFFTPWGDVGDVVIVKNAAHVNFTGAKWDDEHHYQWHTGYPGGLKERSPRSQHKVDPVSVLRLAVRGMLPKNRLRQNRMCKLLLYPDEQHELDAASLVPWEMPPRKLRRKEGLFELPEGFVPMNKAAYSKRFGHMLPRQQIQHMQQQPAPGGIPASQA